MSGSHGGKKIAVLWDMKLCGFVEVDRRFRGTYCLQHQDSSLMVEGVRTSETSVNFHEATRRYIAEQRSLLMSSPLVFWILHVE
jgi:hypothetical protein